MNTTTSRTTSNRHEFNQESERECPAEIQPWDDLVNYLRNYAKQEPEVAACVCLGVGFILGWRLKPW